MSGRFVNEIRMICRLISPPHLLIHSFSTTPVCFDWLDPCETDEKWVLYVPYGQACVIFRTGKAAAYFQRRSEPEKGAECFLARQRHCVMVASTFRCCHQQSSVLQSSTRTQPRDSS